MNDSKGYIKVGPRWLRSLLNHLIISIASHWIFQGMLYMDWSERLFKLCLDGILTVAFEFLLGLMITPPYNWFLAFLIAHTFNFFLNAHFWTLLKHYGLVSNSRERFYNYSEELFRRISSRTFIIYAAAYGSFVRGEWSQGSDLDVRVVHIGLISGLRACSFVLTERTRALFNHFPLDIYVLDGYKRLSEMRPDEKPEVIVDRRVLVP